MALKRPRRKTRKVRRRPQKGGADPLPKTYFIVTTSIIQNGNEVKREREYKQGIKALQDSLNEFPTLKANSKIIIVENNGQRSTFLDGLGEDVVYTENNKNDENKGIKEIKDVLAVMDKYNINGDDMVVKLTGRYSILPNSPFMKTLAERPPTLAAIARVGWFDEQFGLPSIEAGDAVITGLIALKAKHVREIFFANGAEPNIENNWYKRIAALPRSDVVVLQTLGLDMPVADGPVRHARGGKRKNIV